MSTIPLIHAEFHISLIHVIKKRLQNWTYVLFVFKNSYKNVIINVHIKEVL